MFRVRFHFILHYPRLLSFLGTHKQTHLHTPCVWCCVAHFAHIAKYWCNRSRSRTLHVPQIMNASVRRMLQGILPAHCPHAIRKCVCVAAERAVSPDSPPAVPERADPMVQRLQIACESIDVNTGVQSHILLPIGVCVQCSVAKSSLYLQFIEVFRVEITQGRSESIRCVCVCICGCSRCCEHGSRIGICRKPHARWPHNDLYRRI